MAEYYAVLSKAIAGLTNTAPETRRAVYDKARSALVSQLKAIEPPLATTEISRQRLELEEAIRRVEREIQSGTMPVPPRPTINLPSGQPPTVRPAAGDGSSGDGARRTPQDIFRQAIHEAEARGTQGPADAPAMPQETPERVGAVRPPPIIRARPSEPAQAGASATDQFADRLSAARASPEPRLAPDYEFEREQAQGQRAARSTSDRPREVRLGPAPIDPEIDDVTPARRAARGAARDDGAPVPGLGRRRRGNSLARLVVGLLVLVLAGGVAYGAWMQRSTITALVASFDQPASTKTPAQKSPPTAAPAATATLATADPTKNGDRLGGPPPAPAQSAPANPSVRVIGSDPGATATAPSAPATTGSTATGGTALALAPPSTLAPPGARPAQPAPQVSGPQAALTAPPATSPQAGAQLPVTGTQRATLYEEPSNPNLAATSTLAITGSVTWSFTNNAPDGPEIVGMVTIPDRKLKLKVTIRRNLDKSLPASHMVEVLVDTPPDFPGKGVQTIPTMVLKPTEDAKGDALIGASATVAAGYYWIALSNGQRDVSSNVNLLRDRGWIDIRLVYQTGQRAILTLEKGPSGDQAFGKALTAWQTG